MRARRKGHADLGGRGRGDRDAVAAGPLALVGEEGAQGGGRPARQQQAQSPARGARGTLTSTSKPLGTHALPMIKITSKAKETQPCSLDGALTYLTADR